MYPDSYKELFSGNFDSEKFAGGLVGGRYKYAEDPNYKNKLLVMINKVVADMNRNK
jgi:flagellum-specific peptidoglycan hydrolase FlgJ